MKKSLVALAVLAASGAVLAQVKVSGNLTAGFQQTQSAAGVTSGFGVDTAEVTFAASEDLGGGMKAGASLGLVNVARGMPAQTGAGQQPTGFGPANSSVYVSGEFGKITLATARATDYLTGGVAAVGGTFQDGRALSARDVTDSVSYALTAGPVAITLAYSEPNNVVGLGGGTTDNGAQSYSSIGLRYTDGPLVADAGYTMYDEGDVANRDKTNVRVAGSYDLGVAKLGAGWSQRSGQQNGGTRTDMGVAASVPMGALTLGANWVQREFNSSYQGQANVINVGYGLAANYALSKRTSFIADYTAFTGINGGANGTNSEMTTVYNLFLSHSF